jgi:hypothetical protein
MSKVGIATLPLHNSKAPMWLIKRMLTLGKPIFEILYDMEGAEGILKRLSDTYWFQGLACILGFDWHSSGCTTVLGGILKQIINQDEFGIIVAGGKGKNSTKVKAHLLEYAKKLDYNEDNIHKFSEISRLVAKVDNAAVQDGFSLYHHLMLVSEENWAIVQQGLDNAIQKARRYHWISERLDDVLNDPHEDIATELLREKSLNMASNKSNECRKVSLDLIADGPKRIKRYLTQLRNPYQKSLMDFVGDTPKQRTPRIPHLDMPIPFNLQWETLDFAKELALSDYKKLLKIKGIGPGTVRALALISEFIWGTPASWKDPAKYSFAVGGKDGIPYPVNLKRMEKCASILKEAIDQSRLEKKKKLEALKRLHKFTKRKILF